MPANWQPSGILGGRPTTPYALLILNQPVNKNALEATVRGASMLVCADAGAERLRSLGCDDDAYVPDAIVGDLDSATEETLRYYQDKGVKVEKDPDQYSTDFTKSLKWMKQEWQRRNQAQKDLPLDVVVLGGLGGRVDQGFSQIHHLYLADNDPELLSGRIYLLSEQSLSFVLSDGPNNVAIEPGYFEENIGIIPILGPCHLNTTGLEWDVEDWLTEFGGQLSTSNHIRASQIEISFRGPRPLLTLELAGRLTATQSR